MNELHPEVKKKGVSGKPRPKTWKTKSSYKISLAGGCLENTDLENKYLKNTETSKTSDLENTDPLKL